MSPPRVADRGMALAPRLGIFGGTFDPPHHAHLIVASEAFDALDLDLLLFVPAADPPHKRGSVVATAGQRLRMLTAAIAGDSRFRVDDLELTREGTSYTVETLRQIATREAGAELFFVLGADQYRDLESWREPEEVARLATLAVLARDGEEFENDGRYGAIGVPVSRIDLSATQVRRRIAEGRSIRYFVPEEVRRIIDDEGIYGLAGRGGGRHGGE